LAVLDFLSLGDSDDLARSSPDPLHLRSALLAGAAPSVALGARRCPESAAACRGDGEARHAERARAVAAVVLPEYAARYNIQIEIVMFQRFADARTALASGDIQAHRVRSAETSLSRSAKARDRSSGSRAWARVTTA